MASRRGRQPTVSMDSLEWVDSFDGRYDSVRDSPESIPEFVRRSQAEALHDVEKYSEKERQKRLAEDFSAAGLMNRLDEHEFVVLRNAFCNPTIDRRVNEEEFYKILRQTVELKYPKLGSGLLRTRLSELFYTIDRDGVGVDWNTFSSFLIEASLRGETINATSSETILGYAKVLEKSVRSNEEAVRKIVYLPPIKHYLALHRAHTGKLVSADRLGVVTKTLAFPAPIVDADYFAPTESLITSSADCKLRLYSCGYTANTTEVRHVVLRATVDTEECMSAVKSNGGQLFMGSRGGVVSLWCPPNTHVEIRGGAKTKPRKLQGRGIDLVLTREYASHTDTVMDLLILGDGSKVFSCSMDCTVVEQDIIKDITTVYRGHEKGVCSLAYCSDYRLLVSAGFEYCANVWVERQPNIPPFKLEDPSAPHLASLLGVFAVPDTPQVITCDTKGIANIWDIRLLRCIRTLSLVERNDLSYGYDSFHSFLYADDSKCLIFNSSQRTYVYEYQGQTKTDTHLVHNKDQPIAACFFNQATDTILTAAGKDVKLWDAGDGRMKAFYKDLTPVEITAACWDDSGAKFFVGTQSGTIYGFRATDGHRVRCFDLDGSKEITCLGYFGDPSWVLFAGSITGTVTVWSDREARATNVPVQVIEGQRPVKSLAVAADVGLFLVGDEAGLLRAFALDNSVYAPTAIHHMALRRGEVVALTTLYPMPAVIATDSSGSISLWSVRPYRFRDIELSHWENVGGVTGVESPSVAMHSHVAFSPAVLALETSRFEHGDCKHILFCGDETGRIVVWDLWDIIVHARLNKVERIDGHYVNTTPWAFFPGGGGPASNPNSGLLPSPREGPPPTLTHPPVCCHTWKAHREGILSLVFNPRTSVLLSAGMDNQVIFWGIDPNFTTTLIGTLRQWEVHPVLQIYHRRGQIPKRGSLFMQPRKQIPSVTYPSLSSL
eukprot:TRINITY_DN17625_c0_g1_i2.p1 TRINITY_DN17625_c0_g1~~TRINITY_DN17625_c0_g1_i2.p1  ORF type:complete len:957 (+),score=105.05 TRINITY_DN17625_c0_g1_i2:35-2872(+)